MIDDPAQNPSSTHVLAINGGSSSIKFALYRTGARLERVLHGQIDRIGAGEPRLTFTRANGLRPETRKISAPDHSSAADSLIALLEEQAAFTSLVAIGHRVVHGMFHHLPTVVTA